MEVVGSFCSLLYVWQPFLWKVYEEKQKGIRSVLQNEDIYLIFDETINISGICLLTKCERSFLLKIIELTATNAVKINKEILEVSNWLFENDISKYNQA